MAELRFVQQMDTDICDKVAEEVSDREDEIRMQIDQIIMEAAGHASENVMDSVKKETGWDLHADETAYSELSTEFEERLRTTLGMN